MKLRWAIATVSALALALLTLPAPLEWPFGHDDVSASAPGASACPASAKPRTELHAEDLNNKEVNSRRSRAR